GLTNGLFSNVFDAYDVDDLIAGHRRVHAGHVWRAVQEPVDVVGILYRTGLKRKRFFVSQPSGQLRLEAVPQIASDIQVARARSAAQPLHRSAGCEVQTRIAHVERDRPRRLIDVGYDHRAYFVTAPGDCLDVLDEGAFEDHVGDGHEQRLVVNRFEHLVERDGHLVVGRHGDNSRAVSKRVIDVKI